MKLSEIPETTDNQAGPSPTRQKLSQVGSGQAETAEKPADSLWDNFKSFVATSAADLKRGASEIPGEAGRLAGNMARGLLPTEAGARAGGQAVRQLGDIGTFAAGGLTNPLQAPREVAGAAGGLNTQPRIAQVPRPQLALPPPRMGVPGAPPIQTGPGRPAPMTQLGPQMMGNPIKFTPTPGTGMIPQRQGGTMTIPGATPSAGAKPEAGLVDPDAHLGSASPLANAIASNSDQNVVSLFRRGIGAGPPGVRSDRGMTQQDQRITTAVDSIIDARKSLQFRDPKDATGKTLLPAGRLPQTVSEFSQAVDHLKSQIFEQYDGMAQRMSGQGVRVPLDPVINKLQEFLAGPEVRDIEPAVARSAQAQIERFAKVGSYSPKEAQNVISSLNASLEREIKNPTNAVSHNAMNGEILSTLRDTLNQTMGEALKDPRYAGLRHQYGALSSIEGDVANAVRKQLGSGPGFFDKLTNLGTWAGAGASLFTHDLKSVGAGLAAKGGQELYRYMHSPNRAVSRMFSMRNADIMAPPSMSDRASAWLGSGIGGFRQGQADRKLGDPYVSTTGP